MKKQANRGAFMLLCRKKNKPIDKKGNFKEDHQKINHTLYKKLPQNRDELSTDLHENSSESENDTCKDNTCIDSQNKSDDNNN